MPKGSRRGLEFGAPMQVAISAEMACDSGLVGRNAAQSGEVSGRSLLCGVGSLDTTRVKSEGMRGRGFRRLMEGFVLMPLENGDVGVTSSSRHSFGGFCAGAVRFAEVMMLDPRNATD